ncbi:MAG: GNAT family N-acetyltransferase, partial [Candidatus Omnitrophota bacterium]
DAFFYWLLSNPERKLYVTYRLLNESYKAGILKGKSPFAGWSNERIKAHVQEQTAELRRRFRNAKRPPPPVKAKASVVPGEYIGWLEGSVLSDERATDIRQVEEGDVEEVVLLSKRIAGIGAEDVKQVVQNIAQGKESGCRIYVYEEKGKIGGFVHVSLLEEEAVISEIIVKRDLEGEGIASLLLGKALHECLSSGILTFSADVISKASRSFKLFDRFGFEKQEILEENKPVPHDLLFVADGSAQALRHRKHERFLLRRADAALELVSGKDAGIPEIKAFLPQKARELGLGGEVVKGMGYFEEGVIGHTHAKVFNAVFDAVFGIPKDGSEEVFLMTDTELFFMANLFRDAMEDRENNSRLAFINSGLFTVNERFELENMITGARDASGRLDKEKFFELFRNSPELVARAKVALESNPGLTGIGKKKVRFIDTGEGTIPLFLEAAFRIFLENEDTSSLLVASHIDPDDALMTDRIDSEFGDISAFESELDLYKLGKGPAFELNAFFAHMVLARMVLDRFDSMLMDAGLGMVDIPIGRLLDVSYEHAFKDAQFIKLIENIPESLFVKIRSSAWQQQGRKMEEFIKDWKDNFTLAFVELLQNAAEGRSGEPGEVTRVKLDAKIKDGRILIDIIDDGCGFTVESIQGLKNVFEGNLLGRRSDTKGRPGGFGLLMTFKLARSLGGDIEIVTRQIEDFDEKSGTTVHFSLPAEITSVLQEEADGSEFIKKIKVEGGEQARRKKAPEAPDEYLLKAREIADGFCSAVGARAVEARNQKKKNKIVIGIDTRWLPFQQRLGKFDALISEAKRKFTDLERISSDDVVIVTGSGGLLARRIKDALGVKEGEEGKADYTRVAIMGEEKDLESPQLEEFKDQAVFIEVIANYFDLEMLTIAFKLLTGDADPATIDIELSKKEKKGFIRWYECKAKPLDPNELTKRYKLQIRELAKHA